MMLQSLNQAPHPEHHHSLDPIPMSSTIHWSPSLRSEVACSPSEGAPNGLARTSSIMCVRWQQDLSQMDHGAFQIR